MSDSDENAHSLEVRLHVPREPLEGNADVGGGLVPSEKRAGANTSSTGRRVERLLPLVVGEGHLHEVVVAASQCSRGLPSEIARGQTQRNSLGLAQSSEPDYLCTLHALHALKKRRTEDEEDEKDKERQRQRTTTTNPTQKNRHETLRREPLAPDHRLDPQRAGTSARSELRTVFGHQLAAFAVGMRGRFISSASVRCV